MIDGRTQNDSSGVGIKEREGPCRFPDAGTPAGNREEGSCETLGEETDQEVEMTNTWARGCVSRKE